PPDRPHARGRRGHRRPAARHRERRGRADREGAAPEPLRRLPLRRGVALGQRRGGDQQPHGGCGHRRDLPLADLAADPQRRRLPGHRQHGDPRARRGGHRGAERDDPPRARRHRGARRTHRAGDRAGDPSGAGRGLPGLPDPARLRVHGGPMTSAAFPEEDCSCTTGRVLTEDFLRSADEQLAATDELLATSYPGDPGTRQPVHTVYVPADDFTPDLPRAWGERALAAVAEDGLDELARRTAPPGTDPRILDTVVRAVERKLLTEPIEDLRIDFEDGFGDRPDAEEDGQAIAAARAVARAGRAGTAPPFIGIRFKSLEAPTRARALRTLDLFVSTIVRRGGLAEAGISADGLPPGLVLTLPKVSTLEQVQVMVRACEQLEQQLGLEAGRLRFEVQMETAPLILGVDGRSPLGDVIHRTDGRVEALHYGTYDYSDSLQIPAAQQSMERPAADHAKAVMQVAVAGTGVRLSDGSTNILPLGDAAQ